MSNVVKTLDQVAKLSDLQLAIRFKDIPSILRLKCCRRTSVSVDCGDGDHGDFDEILEGLERLTSVGIRITGLQLCNTGSGQ